MKFSRDESWLLKKDWGFGFDLGETDTCSEVCVLCRAGCQNNCIVVLHQHVRLNSLIQNVLKVWILVSVEWVVSVVF